MSIGFKTSGIWTEFGDSDLLHAFFSTICYHLEANNWGSKYPYLQKKLYYEKLDSEEISPVLDELIDIRTKLAVLKPKDVIWDAEDLTKIPPASFYPKKNAVNLSECFIAVSGRNIFEILFEVLEFSKRRRISVKIQSSHDLVK